MALSFESVGRVGRRRFSERSWVATSFAQVALGLPSLVVALVSCRHELDHRRDPEPRAAAQDTAPSGPPPRASATSTRYEDDDFELEAISTTVCPTEAPFLPEAHHERLSILVRIASRSTRPIPVQALAFRVESPKGSYSSTLAGCGPALSVATLSSGQREGGEVAFDVPVDEAPLELVYEPFLLGRPPLLVHVKVPAPKAK
jgi:hypothetical protein